MTYSKEEAELRDQARYWLGREQPGKLVGLLVLMLLGPLLVFLPIALLFWSWIVPFVDSRLSGFVSVIFGPLSLCVFMPLHRRIYEKMLQKKMTELKLVQATRQ